MPQFFIPPRSKVGDRVTLSSSESHHIRDVFRCQIGQSLRLVDGQGHAFEGEIFSFRREGVVVILQKEKDSTPSVSPLILALALLKKDKMEFCIQKAAELGVTSLQPMTTSRTIAKPTERDKTTRWQKIADEATKQCGRPTRMVVKKPIAFSETLKNPGRKIFFWEESQQSLHNGLGTSSINMILIGPEGGFSEKEVDQAGDAGCTILSLGNNILRAETAVIVAITLVQYESGNLLL